MFSHVVFLSLLLGAQLNLLFNSAHFATEMREALEDSACGTLEFWFGTFTSMAAIFSIFGIVATFTAWGMISSISQTNTHCMLRSSIGHCVTTLPSRFVVASLYSFLVAPLTS